MAIQKDTVMYTQKYNARSEFKRLT